MSRGALYSVRIRSARGYEWCEFRSVSASGSARFVSVATRAAVRCSGRLGASWSVADVLTADGVRVCSISNPAPR